MKSNYKKLGQFIRIVDIRNKNLQETNLIGLSIKKQFIKSISNTIGTDMSTYRIINKDQFAYCSVTSRNGEKITIALYQEAKTAMVSQAYDVFEIIDVNKLLPEYLMMWFRRPEFDRYARFMSHGSVREMFSWEDMCNVTLPVPKIEKQKEIVDEYNVLVGRIRLNNKIIQKLEETAQAIYKQFINQSTTNNIETLANYLESANTGLDAIKRAPIVNEDTGVKCLRIQNISSEANLDYWGFTKVEKNNFRKFQLKKDDIIVARTGATVGGNMFIKKDLNAVFNNGLIRIRADRTKVHPIILKAFFKTKSFIEHIDSIAFGTSTQPNIQIGDLLSFRISFPYIQNIENIIEQLIMIDNFSFELKEQINIIEKIRVLLLSKLVTIGN